MLISQRFAFAVTGGTSGLGLALVRLLAAIGARVAFVARTAPTVGLIAKETGACGIVGDVGRKEDIYPLALQITGNLGGLSSLSARAMSSRNRASLIATLTAMSWRWRTTSSSL